MDAPSNSAVDRAGKVLRRLRNVNEMPSRIEREEALAVLRDFRASFQLPLTKANMGLRSFARTATRDNPSCSQRLKQPPRIIDKLYRKPTMRLSQMEDVGGCRVVLPGLEGVYKVASRIRNTGRVLYEDDANYTDRATGYRSLHIVVDYDSRRVEMQLRTQRQQEWAEHVEELDDELGTALKDGDGPEEMLTYLKKLANAYATLDGGGTLDEEAMNEFAAARDAAEYYLRETRGTP